MAEKEHKDAKEEKPEKTEKVEKAEKAEKQPKAEKKEKGEKAEKKEAAPKGPVKADYGKDFKYIVRIVNSDLDGTKPTFIAIQGVMGVGARVADVVCRRSHVDRTAKIGTLPDSKIEEMEKLINTYSEYAPTWALNRQNDIETGADLHIVSTDLEIIRKDDINRMKMVRSYKGVRHETGQKVRGQRTRSNGRTGLTLGVMRQKLAQQAAGAKTEGAAKEEKK
ncbi:MAG: 30S ribosomal protein S13 [Methanomassiliicoccales archaeon PtaU1.Bin124]|nr:MAG: 30S ribosomal protein S13 [Methanomassiliicoccales archaeon PtaU1.Bin124]